MNYSVLFVDDEPDLNEICCEIFEMEGFKVFSAASAKNALTVLDNQPIDVVISDARMPTMSGFELFDYVRELEKMPLFYLSTGVVDINEKDLLDKGAAGVITKPYNVDELVERVRNDLKNLA